MSTDPAFQRLRLLVGDAALERIRSARVILFGIGGVGSWCAEALVRSGIGHLTIVDGDTVCATNINRQLQATSANIGAPKVDELHRRLVSIHPGPVVEPLDAIYDKATRDRFDLGSYDCVVDAIDSYTQKLDLIEHAWGLGTPIFSSMGAAGRLDPTKIRTASLWHARMDRFAKILRKGLRRRDFQGDLQCVYSEEPAILPLEPEPSPPVAESRTDGRVDWNERKIVINGSAVHVTASFGMALAGLVLRHVQSVPHRRTP
jgi:tRNA A37 threonylcarbamoyladenosine dehydratase